MLDKGTITIIQKMLDKILFQIPKNVLNVAFITDLREILSDQTIVGSFTILERSRKKTHTEVLCVDQFDNTLTLVFFYRAYSKRTRVIRSKITVFGKVTKNNFRTSIVHPTLLDEEETPFCIGNIPIYHSSVQKNNEIRQAIAHELKKTDLIEDWLDASILTKYAFTSFQKALYTVHHPKSKDDITPRTSKALSRLIFDEFIAYHHLFHKKHQIQSHMEAPSFSNPYKNLVDSVIENLPFSLTADQQRVFGEISDDLSKKIPMLRLLQGDVGSGKTLVALLSLIRAVENGYQGAFLVPTELLARQHMETFTKYVKGLGISVALLISKVPSKQKKYVLDGLKTGHIHIVIGTHALIQEKVQFFHLGMVVIDEQHRFGIKQRNLLLQKANLSPHVLLMSATPIPRTLYLAHTSHIALSTIKQKPKGRKDITTLVMPNQKLHELEGAIMRQLEKGHQGYWVCPLIDEHETLTGVLSRLKHLKEKFISYGVGLIHGRMSSDEKEAIMQDFLDNKIHLLVATTIVEVGIDVPNATVIVIEHADLFGLAQLHQLRGRVGRASYDSYCILLYNNELSGIAKKRLSTLKTTSDGFEIAKKDLSLRGSGNLLEMEQSGFLRFRLCHFAKGSEEDILYLEHLFHEAFLSFQQIPFEKRERLSALFAEENQLSLC